MKRVFVFLGYVVKEVKILGFLKVDILKDMDLDFVELNLFDDVDVLDWFIKKVEVYSGKVEYIYCDFLL